MNVRVAVVVHDVAPHFDPPVAASGSRWRRFRTSTQPRHSLRTVRPSVRRRRRGWAVGGRSASARHQSFDEYLVRRAAIRGAHRVDTAYADRSDMQWRDGRVDRLLDHFRRKGDRNG